MNQTIDYYNKNAESYFGQTAGADFSETYDRFLKYVPAGGRIMDAGCGSGRDAAAFVRRGYDAAGLDASEALAEIAREKQGIPVTVCSMADWQAETPYDGIWCCASLLHLSDEEVRGFFRNLPANLGNKGALFVSVKTGIETGYDEKGRFMRNFTEDEVRSLCESAGLTIQELWETRDKLGRKGLDWLNVIAVRGRSRIEMKDLTLLETPDPVEKVDPRFDQKAADSARRFHRSLPTYKETELHALDATAAALGVKKIFLKDESTRFGLKAFKGLGGSYAVFRILCERFGMDPGDAAFSDFQTEEMKEKCRQVDFVTATDGNHGRGVAWAARLFGCRAHVYMPAGSSEARRQAIEDAGAKEAVITDLNYDQAVALANSTAEEKGWILVQDTAWEGYEQIPGWIIEGYLTMGAEIREQLGDLAPTHIFLQAGVGAMAGGMTGYFASSYKAEPPVFTIVEPDTVACLYLSAEAGDGEIHSVEGDPVTIMAGLNCGTPCRITWPIIRDHARFYCACTDDVSRWAMRKLAKAGVTAGECGAVTFGALCRIAEDEKARTMLGLDENSVILLISTEGDTDPEYYRKVISEQEVPAL